MHVLRQSSRVLSYEAVAFACLQQQLCEAKECLQAASRLSEQLEKKDEQIARLNEEGNHCQRLIIFSPACIFLLVHTA